ncbi:uncharacterized protein [Lolium perenne]|uniref:uncharacterized protein n=1 Tax=Lolium perenne TaxID=4522 RepID=UPI0021F5DBD9|nr:uncharacterized protein LOC127326735 [Lolium perenne]
MRVFAQPPVMETPVSTAWERPLDRYVRSRLEASAAEEAAMAEQRAAAERDLFVATTAEEAAVPNDGPAARRSRSRRRSPHGRGAAAPLPSALPPLAVEKREPSRSWSCRPVPIHPPARPPIRRLLSSSGSSPSSGRRCTDHGRRNAELCRHGYGERHRPRHPPPAPRCLLHGRRVRQPQERPRWQRRGRHGRAGKKRARAELVVHEPALLHIFFTGEEEFQLALFRNSNRKNLFADRIFDLFDRKCNGVIELEEFVRSLHIFHPDTPTAEKIAFAFRLYDLRGTGSIEREEEMVLAILNESDLPLMVKLWKSCSFPRKSQGGSSPDPCQCNIGQELWPKVVILLDIFAWVLSWVIYPLCSVKIQLFFLGTSRR